MALPDDQLVVVLVDQPGDGLLAFDPGWWQGVASRYDPASCYLDAWTRSEADVKRLTEAFPGARTQSYGADGVGLPVCVSVGLEGFAMAAEALRIGAGITPCHVLWHNLKWPSVSALGLGEEHKYAGLQVACHSRGIHYDEPAPEHTVFVHAGPGDDARAAWLAERVGAQVVGPPEFGW